MGNMHENLVNFGCLVSETCEQTDRQTDEQIYLSQQFSPSWWQTNDNVTKENPQDQTRIRTSLHEFHEINAVQLLDGPIIRTSASSARCSMQHVGKVQHWLNIGLV